MLALLCAGARAGRDDDGNESSYNSLSSGGGEFKVTSLTGVGYETPSHLPEGEVELFHTFCIEQNEYLSGIKYYKVNTEAVNGGDGGGSPDPLDTATAKLYYAFWTNSWYTTGVGYNYTDTTQRTKDARDLQFAIWALEGEMSPTNLTGKALTYYNWAKSTATWSGLGKSGWTDIGNVRVLNTYGDAAMTQVKQDLLILVPLPAGALMGLAMLGGLGAVAAVRRRRRLSVQ